MDQDSEACAVCGQDQETHWIVVESRGVWLCTNHASVVRKHKPRTFEAMRDLFRPRCGIVTLADRRSPVPRRDPFLPDRRFFPRPEGRRASAGRRVTDSEE